MNTIFPTAGVAYKGFTVYDFQEGDFLLCEEGIREPSGLSTGHHIRSTHSPAPRLTIKFYIVLHSALP